MTYTLWLFDKADQASERLNKGTCEQMHRSCNDLPFWKWQLVTYNLN